MAYIETTTLSETVFRPTVWKCYIDDIFSLWDNIEAFIEQANLHHTTIKFTTETSVTETAFLDTVVYKSTRFKEKYILDAKTHFKRVTLQKLKKDLSKEKPWESYENTPQKQPLTKIIQISKKRLMERGYPQTLKGTYYQK